MGLMWVERVWRRDGSVNVMEPKVAAENLQSHASDPGVRRRSLAGIQKELAKGYVFYTPHAFFRRVC